MSARKAHNAGRNHIVNVRDYFASLGVDRAQTYIDQVVSQHESGPMGGRNMMMNAPSMRLGAGFMNPVATAPAGGFPPQMGYNKAGPSGGAPPYRPPFPPNASGPGGAKFNRPPFPPNHSGMGGGMPIPNNNMPPFPPSGPGGAMGVRPGGPGGMNGFGAGAPPVRPGLGMSGSGGAPGMGPGGVAGAGPGGPPPSFVPAQGPPSGGNPGIHPDRLRMLGQM